MKRKDSGGGVRKRAEPQGLRYTFYRPPSPVSEGEKEPVAEPESILRHAVVPVPMPASGEADLEYWRRFARLLADHMMGTARYFALARDGSLVDDAVVVCHDAASGRLLVVTSHTPTDEQLGTLATIAERFGHDDATR